MKLDRFSARYRNNGGPPPELAGPSQRELGIAGPIASVAEGDDPKKNPRNNPNNVTTGPGPYFTTGYDPDKNPHPDKKPPAPSVKKRKTGPGTLDDAIKNKKGIWRHEEFEETELPNIAALLVEVSPVYHKGAVDNAIASSNRSGRRISMKGAKLIHAILSGTYDPTRRSTAPKPASPPVRKEELEKVDTTPINIAGKKAPYVPKFRRVSDANNTKVSSAPPISVGRLQDALKESDEEGPDLRSRSVPARGEVCSWCNSIAANGKLKKYYTETLKGHITEHAGVFCSKACHDIHHA